LYLTSWTGNFVLCAIGLAKMTLGVNFTNVLSTAFLAKVLKAHKLQSSYQCCFALLGSVRVKAASKTLVKLTPGVGVDDGSHWQKDGGGFRDGGGYFYRIT